MAQTPQPPSNLLSKHTHLAAKWPHAERRFHARMRVTVENVNGPYGPDTSSKWPTLENRVSRAAAGASRPAAELCLDALVRGRVAAKLRQSDPKTVFVLLQPPMPAMRECEVRQDPSFVLAVAQLAHGRGRLLEECRRSSIVADVAQGEREVVLSQGDGAEIVRLTQELEGARVQLDRRCRRTAAPLFGSSRIQAESLALNIDLSDLQRRSRAPALLDALRDPARDRGAEVHRGGDGGAHEGRTTCTKTRREATALARGRSNERRHEAVCGLLQPAAVAAECSSGGDRRQEEEDEEGRAEHDDCEPDRSEEAAEQDGESETDAETPPRAFGLARIGAEQVPQTVAAGRFHRSDPHGWNSFSSRSRSRILRRRI